MNNRMIKKILAWNILFIAISFFSSCTPDFVECENMDPLCNMDVLAAYGLLYSEQKPLQYESKYLVLSRIGGTDVLKIDPATGGITAVYNNAFGLVNSIDMFSDPAGNHLYAVQPLGGGTLHGFDIDANDNFNTKSGYPVTLSAYISGKYNSDTGIWATAYNAPATVSGTTYSSSIKLYDFDVLTGSYVTRPDTPLGMGCYPTNLVFNSTATRLYGGNTTALGPSAGTYTFSRADEFSNFQQGTPATVGLVTPNRYMLTPDDDLLLGFGAANVNLFSVDVTTGIATYSGLDVILTAQSMFTHPSNRFTPDGKFLYGLDLLSNSISGVIYDSVSNTFRSIAGFPFGTVNGPVYMDIDPSGTYMYVVGDDTLGKGELRVYVIQPDGTLIEDTTLRTSLATTYSNGDIHIVTQEKK